MLHTIKTKLIAAILAVINPSKTIAFLAHVTTVVTFGSAIYAWFYPDIAGEYLSRLSRQITETNRTLDEVANSSSETAANTQTLAEAVADRPRASLRRFKTRSTHTGIMSQFYLQNMVTKPLREVAIVFQDAEGKPYSSFDVFTIPPLETAMDQTDVPVVTVCFSFIPEDGRGVRYTEFRRFKFNERPTLDDMGNAATYDVKFMDYNFISETDPTIMTCEEEVYSVEKMKAVD